MIPLTPMSNYIRDSRFVKEEWEGLQLAKLADAIDSGWKGLLMLNCAMYDPKRSWEFFSSEKFQSRWLVCQEPGLLPTQLVWVAADSSDFKSWLSLETSIPFPNLKMYKRF